MRLARFLAIALGTLVVFFFAVPAHTQAQSNSTRTATITGTLTDPSDAVVSAAQVTAQPLDSAAPAPPITTRSGPDGKFVLTLAPGSYRVTINDRSFERQQREFTLTAGSTETWDVRLALREESATVIVSATTIPIEADKSPFPVDGNFAPRHQRSTGIVARADPRGDPVESTWRKRAHTAESPRCFSTAEIQTSQKC